MMFICDVLFASVSCLFTFLLGKEMLIQNQGLNTVSALTNIAVIAMCNALKNLCTHSRAKQFDL